MSIATAKTLLRNITSGQVAPIYFLMGEESYYIDKIARHIEDTVLQEEEKGFNQMILYGKDVSVDDVIAQAKRYPMMAERQVVIVKEAQELSRTIENFASYIEHPQPTTVLVICYKYKTLDKRKKLSKLVAQNGVLFESKKLYENQVPDWIQSVLDDKGYTIVPKASRMLVEFLGNDLGKVHNELEKLCLLVPSGEPITPQLIEENIGISKDFNNFELQNAIGAKDMKKAFKIVQYFSQNPRNHPIVMTMALLHSFFSKLLKYHALSNKSEAPKIVGVSPYFIKDYEAAAHNYDMRKVSAVIASIREIDMKSKGVGAANLPQGDLLKELLIAIFD